MQKQNYSNHKRTIILFIVILFFMILALIGGAFHNLFISFGDESRLYNASLISLVSVCLLFLFFFTRSFSLRAQDRAIRAEENLRHFVLTGKLLDPRLTIRQIIGLRFALGDEFVALAKRAVEENLSEDDIKKAVKNWKGDYYRV
jgi:Ca2+/Na+ antiporter